MDLAVVSRAITGTSSSLLSSTASCPSLGDVATKLRPVLREPRNPAVPRWKIRKLGRNACSFPHFLWGLVRSGTARHWGWAGLDLLRCCSEAAARVRATPVI
jgi:hypothetical protein